MTTATCNDLFRPLPLAHGRGLTNRFALAPLTNTQSHADGTLADEEYRWLTMRARGGFGMIMTCAAHIQASGQGYPGQLGAYHDRHLSGLTRLAEGVKAGGSVACLQLAHSGRQSLDRSTRIAPSDDDDSGARGMTETDIERLIADFVSAALRGQQAGFDGVEIHAAHGFLPTQFLSPEHNRRTDPWGGALNNRARLVFALLERIRAACRDDFQVGLRLSPERFGLRFAEMREVAELAMQSGLIDWLDLSIWDVTKEPEAPEFAGRSVLSWFATLNRGQTRLGVAGKIMNASSALRCLDSGADFVLIGRGAVLAHDFPRQVRANPHYHAPSLPVTADHLRREGLGEAFIDYLRPHPGFVAEEQTRSLSAEHQ